MKGTDVTSKGVKKKDVKQTLRNGLTVNVVGMGAALLGLQAMVGMLVRYIQTTHVLVGFVSFTDLLSAERRVPALCHQLHFGNVHCVSPFLLCSSWQV